MTEYKHLIIDKPGICYAVLPSTLLRDYLLDPTDAHEGYLKTSHALNLVHFASFDWELTLQVRDYLEKLEYNSEIIFDMTGTTIRSQCVPKFDVIHLNYFSDTYWQYVDNYERIWQTNTNKVHQNEVMDFISVHGLFNLYLKGSREKCQRQHEKEYGLKFMNKIRADFQNPNII